MRTTTESPRAGRTAPAATCARPVPKAVNVPRANAATAAPRVSDWSIRSVLVLMSVSVADRPHAGGQHGFELEQRGFTLAEGVEVIAIDGGIVRRVVERFPHHVTRPIECRETGPHC